MKFRDELGIDRASPECESQDDRGRENENECVEGSGRNREERGEVFDGNRYYGRNEQDF
jgi:hypothetical protein